MSRVRLFKIAVLLSGSGTTLENLLVKRDDGKLDVDFSIVISSRPDAYGLERARRRQIPVACVPRKNFKGCNATEEFSTAIFDLLKPYPPDLVVLAGFMCKLSVPPEYLAKVINVHPALLPSFGGKGYYGHHVHEAVLAHGCKVSGCTVHLVDNEYDHGAILGQRAVAVLANDTADTLAQRVQEAERELYPEVIQSLAAVAIANGTLR
jgi:formyltetrahydrofolate-dependent phosphoribosylglycinamide formyltransferase